MAFKEIDTEAYTALYGASWGSGGPLDAKELEGLGEVEANAGNAKHPQDFYYVFSPGDPNDDGIWVSGRPDGIPGATAGRSGRTWIGDDARELAMHLLALGRLGLL